MHTYSVFLYTILYIYNKYIISYALLFYYYFICIHNIIKYLYNALQTSHALLVGKRNLSGTLCIIWEIFDKLVFFINAFVAFINII